MMVNYDRGTFYFWLRLLLLGASASYIGYEYYSGDALILKKQWSPELSNIYCLGAMFLFSVFGSMIVVTIQAKSNKESLTISSWFENPFSLSQPFQFYHMAAWLFLTGGVVHLCATYLKYGVISDYGLMMFIVGVGVRLGAAISAGRLEHRFEDESAGSSRFRRTRKLPY